MRPSWKGSIEFGLVAIDVGLYPAIAPHTLGFKLLHAKCHTPITYLRWFPHCKQEVSWDEIVKGMQLKDGTYFIMTPEALKKLKPKKTESIAIAEFVDPLAVDPLLTNSHYYVAPLKSPYNAFFLFAQALSDLDRVAIGQFALRDKEYVCLIRPYKNILLLTTLNYGYEVRKFAAMEEIAAPKLEARELKLAELLITKLTKKKFDINQFKDTFATELVKKIQQMKKGVVIPEKKKEIKKPKAVSLVKALEASLSEYEETGKAARSH